jgi:DNA invertase Pin-like site-specific DNA recombinase
MGRMEKSTPCGNRIPEKAMPIIANSDRLLRDAHFLLGLQKADVDFVCADMPEANKLMSGLPAVVAQHERDQISSRTKAALAAAKARRTTLGGFRVNAPLPPSALGRPVRTAEADAFAQRVVPLIADLRQQGFSLARVARTLTGKRVKTACGGAWTATAVKNAMARL